MKKIFAGFVIASAFVTLFLAILLMYIAQKSSNDTKVKSDVIIVLGGHVISGTDCTGPICKQKGFVMRPHPNPCVVARVDHAVALYKDEYAPKILMSGGDDKETGANEAETMKKWAIERGVPEGNILIENKSTSTYENLRFSKEIIERNGISSVIIVTEPYHIGRAGLVATKLKYDYSLSPAVESMCWNKENFFANWNFVKKEPWAILGYKVLGKI